MLQIKSLLQKASSKTASQSPTPQLTEELLLRTESEIRKSIDPSFSLDSWLVDPQGVHYFPHFLPAPTCKDISVCIQAQPSHAWISLTHAKRRLQKWGGDVSEHGLINVGEIPPFLLAIVDKLQEERVTQKRCNHFLVNEYKGQAGILPHTDGPLYHPWVSVLSLGNPILFKFYNSHADTAEDQTAAVLLIEEGSLLVFHGKYYHELLHGISEVGVESLAIKLDIRTAGGLWEPAAMKLSKNPSKAETTEWSCSISTSQSVLNFDKSRLYLDLLKPRFATGAFDGQSSLEELVGRLKAEFDGKKLDGRYTADVLEQFAETDGEEGDPGVRRLIGCRLVVSWVRDTRVSLTIRHVPLADIPGIDG